MKRCLIALVLVLFLVGLVQARSVTCGGGKLIVSGGDTKGWGGGTFLDIGAELNPGEYPRMITWAQYDAEKSNEGVDVDNIAGCVSLLTEQLVPKVKMGAFLTTGVGGGWIEGEKPKVSVFGNIGVYFDLTEKTQIQLGANASNVGGFNTYGVKLGLAIYH